MEGSSSNFFLGFLSSSVPPYVLFLGFSSAIFPIDNVLCNLEVASIGSIVKWSTSIVVFWVLILHTFRWYVGRFVSDLDKQHFGEE